MANIENLSRSGRPKGARNKSLLNKTRIFRDAFSEDDLVRCANMIKEVAFNEDLHVSERKAYIEFILKYNIVDVATEIKADLVKEQTEAFELSHEQVSIAIEKLKEKLTQS